MSTLEDTNLWPKLLEVEARKRRVAMCKLVAPQLYKQIERVVSDGRLP
jgi:hypothetical protein